MNLKAAILGGTSHIARALTPYLLEAGTELTLFARSPELLAAAPCRIIRDFSALKEEKYDLVINCIGAGTPNELANDFNRWFSVLEKFDNLVLDYLQKVNPEALYVMFSSGAVYGRQSHAPAAEGSSWNFFPNRVKIQDYYAIAKLYSEAKHRSLPALRIADLRIFSFFSRHIDLDSGYFMTDLVKAVIENRVLETAPGDMLRDYPHPADLAALILRCAGEKKINQAIDVASSKAVAKSEILKTFAEHFALQYRCSAASCGSSPNGEVNVYVPTVEMAEKVLNWRAEKSSIETLLAETGAILNAVKEKKA